LYFGDCVDVLSDFFLPNQREYIVKLYAILLNTYLSSWGGCSSSDQQIIVSGWVSGNFLSFLTFWLQLNPTQLQAENIYANFNFVNLVLSLSMLWLSLSWVGLPKICLKQLLLRSEPVP
jgi:hypothetical protein